jgi:hypothetical protein
MTDPARGVSIAALAFTDRLNFDVETAVCAGQKRVAQRTSRQRHVKAEAKPDRFAAAGGSSVDEQRVEIRLGPLHVLEEILASVGRTEAVAMPGSIRCVGDDK